MCADDNHSYASSQIKSNWLHAYKNGNFDDEFPSDLQVNVEAAHTTDRSREFVERILNRIKNKQIVQKPIELTANVSRTNEFAIISIQRITDIELENTDELSLESTTPSQSIEVDHRDSSDDQGSSIESPPSNSCQQSEDVHMVNVAVEEITIKEEEIHDVEASTAQNFEDDDSDSIDSETTELVEFDFFSMERDIDLSHVKAPPASIEIEGSISLKPSLFPFISSDDLLPACKAEPEFQEPIEAVPNDVIKIESDDDNTQNVSADLCIDQNQSVHVILEDINQLQCVKTTMEARSFDFLRKKKRPSKPLPESESDQEQEPDRETDQMLIAIEAEVCQSSDSEELSNHDDFVYELSSDYDSDVEMLN